MRLVVMSLNGNAYQHEIKSVVGTEYEATFTDVNGNQLTISLDKNRLIVFDRFNQKRYKILRWWIE